LSLIVTVLPELSLWNLLLSFPFACLKRPAENDVVAAKAGAAGSVKET
jgi:hypothetical protein